MMREFTQALQSGFDALGLSLSPDPFLEYLELLQKWNHAYNLTAIRTPIEMIQRHLLDSLAIVPWIKGPRILDVGTGPGLPGIPLALANPKWQITLLDSNGKKTRFLQEAKRCLSLNQVEIVQSRVESYRPSLGFDTVVSRAFSELKLMLDWTHHLVVKDGIWVAMKGRVPVEELQILPNAYQVESYAVPGINEERCCIIMKKE